MITAEQFVVAWTSSTSTKEVAAKLALSEHYVLTRASYYPCVSG